MLYPSMGGVIKMSSVVVFQTLMNFIFGFVLLRNACKAACFYCEICHKLFVKSLPKWLFLVHESDFLCFECSCYTHIMFYCENSL